jgi:single-stranded DNA-binding protein
MAGYQQTLIIGNVGGDPQTRYTQAGVAVCNFSVAVTRRWTDSAGARQDKRLRKWLEAIPVAWRLARLEKTSQ